MRRPALQAATAGAVAWRFRCAESRAPRTNATPAPAERVLGGVAPHEAPPVVIEDDGAIVRAVPRPPAPALAVRRRPCRPRPDARPRPAAFRRHLDRRARGRFSLGGARQRAPVRSADPAGELARAPDGAFVVVMTHNHPLDLAIVHAALAAAPPGAAGRFGYVGLIGSASKRRGSRAGCARPVSRRIGSRGSSVPSA